MLKNGEWELIISNNPNNDYVLMAEIWKGENEIADIKANGEQIIISWFKSDENIDIPFDWFFEAMQIAKDRVS